MTSDCLSSLTNVWHKGVNMNLQVETPLLRPGMHPIRGHRPDAWHHEPHPRRGVSARSEAAGCLSD
jgi:hypothetical protein